jgi:hypothetical protein
LSVEGGRSTRRTRINTKGKASFFVPFRVLRVDRSLARLLN